MRYNRYIPIESTKTILVSSDGIIKMFTLRISITTNYQEHYGSKKKKYFQLSKQHENLTSFPISFIMGEEYQTSKNCATLAHNQINMKILQNQGYF